MDMVIIVIILLSSQELHTLIRRSYYNRLDLGVGTQYFLGIQHEPTESGYIFPSLSETCLFPEYILKFDEKYNGKYICRHLVIPSGILQAQSTCAMLRLAGARCLCYCV